MRAFDFVMTLYSFVYALGVAHILAAVGDLLRAGRRVRFSWLSAGWMLNALLVIVSWWLALWDLRAVTTWTMPVVLVLFGAACLIYLFARLVSPAVPREGPVDLRAFHQEEGRKYASVYTAIIVMSILMVWMYGAGTQNWAAENESNWPALAAGVAAAVSRTRWVQVVALIVIDGLWLWYFAALQGPLN